MTFVSYAQNFEDVRLWRALQHISFGSYIDIGAQHPVVDSVSKAFYLRGWRGIHAEATPAYAEAVRADRPDELVVEAAVTTATEPLTFFEIPNTGLSTGDPEVAESHRRAGFAVNSIAVNVIPLSQILDGFEVEEIHWMKIDVEGMERDVLESWGASPVRPWILVIESTYPNSQECTESNWIDLVLQRQYHEVAFDGLSRFFVSDAHPELDDAVASPPSVFDGFSISPHHFAARHISANFESETVALHQAMEEAFASRLAEQAQQFDVHEAQLAEVAAQARQQIAQLNSDIASQNEAIADLRRQRDELNTRIELERGHGRVQLIEQERAAMLREAALVSERNLAHFKLETLDRELSASSGLAVKLKVQRDELAKEARAEREQSRSQLIEQEKAILAREVELAAQARELALQQARLAEFQHQRDTLLQDLSAERERFQAQASQHEKNSLLRDIEIANERSLAQGRLTSLEAELRAQQERVAEALMQREILAQQVDAERKLSSVRLDECQRAYSRIAELERQMVTRENVLAGELKQAVAKIEALELDASALHAAQSEQHRREIEHVLAREQSRVTLDERTNFWNARLSELQAQLDESVSAMGQLRIDLTRAHLELSEHRESSSVKIALLQSELAQEQFKASSLVHSENVAQAKLVELGEQLASEINLNAANVANFHALIDRQLAEIAAAEQREAEARSALAKLELQLVEETAWRDRQLAAIAEQLNAEALRANDVLDREQAALAEVAVLGDRLSSEISWRDAQLTQLSTERDTQAAMLAASARSEVEARQAIAELSARLQEAGSLIDLLRAPGKSGFARKFGYLIAHLGTSGTQKLDHQLAAWYSAPAVHTDAGKWPFSNAEPRIMKYSRDPFQPAQSLDELRSLYDTDFIRCAYVTLLGRRPDAKGEAYYVARLREGHAKLKILGQMRKSQEGKAYPHGIPGLDRAIALYRAANLPLVGWLVRLFSDQERQSRHEMWLRRIENEFSISSKGIETAIARSEQAAEASSQVQTSLAACEARIASRLEEISNRSDALAGLGQEIIFKINKHEADMLSISENIGYANAHTHHMLGQFEHRLQSVQECNERLEASSEKIIQNNDYATGVSLKALDNSEHLKIQISDYMPYLENNFRNIGYANLGTQSLLNESRDMTINALQKLDVLDERGAKSAPITVEDIFNIAS